MPILATLASVGGVLTAVKGILSPIERINSKLQDVRIAKMKSESDETRLEYREREIQLEAQRDVLIAEQQRGGWYKTSVRPTITWIFIIYLAKLVVWDKVLGLGSTDPLSPELAALMSLVLTSHFLGRAYEMRNRSKAVLERIEARRNAVAGQ